uniref:Uncharacterized protein n=1 Tax=Rhizophora mucronata TaxID=61149 RepID=A0A2P2JBW8_RHIMU
MSVVSVDHKICKCKLTAASKTS